MIIQQQFKKTKLASAFAVIGALSIISIAALFSSGSTASAQSTGYIRVVNNCPTSVIFTISNNTGIYIQRIALIKQSITYTLPAPAQYTFRVGGTSKIININAPVNGKAYSVTTYTC